MLCGCASRRPLWVSEVSTDEASGLVTRVYDVRHFLAKEYFDVQLALSGSSGGSSGPPETEPYDEVQEIQSNTILEIVKLRTTIEPPRPVYTKSEYMRLARILPIKVLKTGVYKLTASRADHVRVLKVLQVLKPRFKPRSGH
jgi:hypothetical protein